MTSQNTKKRALITGACGFIGHALLEELLLNTDYDIVCLDRLDISGTLDRVKSVIDKCPKSVNAHNRVSFVYHDLKAEINEYTRVKIGDINYVFHLAAGSHVDRSIEFPSHDPPAPTPATSLVEPTTRGNPPALKPLPP